MAYGYYEAKQMIDSGQPYTLGSAATSWRNFAEALRNASAHTQGTSDNVTAQYGAPYQNFGDRAQPIASWLNGVSSNADSVASGLENVHQVGTSAQFTAASEDYSFSQDVDKIVGPEDALSMGRAAAIQRREQQAANVLNGEITKWSSAYTAFQPGTIGAAPTTSGGSGGGAGGSGASGGGGTTTRTQPTGGPTGGTDNGVRNGGGPISDPAGPQQHNPVANGGSTSDFPISSVIGKDDPNFPGWVRDPTTGFLINPKTGQEFDPIHNQWIDPVTGKPFGEVVNQATRLEGLTGGTSTVGGLFGNGGNVGLVGPLPPGGGGGGGGSFGIPPNLWGGTLPPSLNPNNPAARQLAQNAMERMGMKAYAAEQLAIREAQQGGRPYLPPTQAGGAGGFGGGRSGPRSRLNSEPEGTWTSRPGGRTQGGRWVPNGGAGVGGSEEKDKKRKSRREAFPNGEEPLLDDGLDGNDGISTAGLVGTAGLIGTAGAIALGRNAFGGGRLGGGESGGTQPYLPPTQTGGVAGRGGRSGSRGGGMAEEAGMAGRGGAAGRRSYLPPMQGGQSREQEDRKRQRPDWLVEDDIWSAGTQAGPAVLGED